MKRLSFLVPLFIGSIGFAQSIATTPVLPPLMPWEGKSRKLVAAKGDPWITPAERSEFRTTPSYADTLAYLRRLEKASSLVRLTSIGKSPEGRDLWLVIVSKDRAFTPSALRATGKPSLFAQGGIHAGEIDGKDAGLMLVRDMTAGGSRKELLDHANFLFLPIFNVDGHERTPEHSRVNQRGPENAGWRTTSRNLNLNRDYAKADTPEMRALIGALNAWDPALYFDLHVTDGADYQYDITWGFNRRYAHSPKIAAWLEESLSPAMERDLKAMGHIPGPLIFNIDPWDISKGIAGWVAGPRFSSGYGDARHLPTILVENHSLKPYAQRVLGTYALLESAMRHLGANGAALRNAIESDRARRASSVPLTWKVAPDAAPPMIEFLGIESKLAPSAISGGLRIEYTGEPVSLRIPQFWASHPDISVKRPSAYWIHPAWSEVVERMAVHGIRMERIDAPRQVEVEMYRLGNAKFASSAFEGRVNVTAEPVAERRSETYPAGSVRVSTDQPLGDLAVLLLEPSSPDSFFQWGFFSEVLEATEYIEGYAIEPMAERMLAADPKLALEFRAKLANDESFRSSATARLEWFYRRTPFADARWKLYPVGRE